MADVDGGDILIRIRGDASELEAEIGRAQGALGDLEGGADDTSSSLSSMGKTAGQLNTALKGMNRGGINAVAAGLSMVNPQAARLVRTLGAMRLLTGPLAIALGVVAAAFAAYKHEVDKASEAAERAQERIEAFNDAFNDQAVIAKDLRNELRLIQGEIDKDGLAHEKRKTRIQAAGDAVVAAIDEQIEAQQKLIDEQEQERQVSVKQQEQVAALKQEMARLTQERRDAIEATESQLEAADAIAEFHRESKEAAEGHADAQAGLADSIENTTDTLQEQIEKLSDFANTLEPGGGFGQPAGIDELVGRINDLTRAEDDLLSKTEQLNLEQAALDVEFARGNVTLDQYRTLTNEISNEVGRLNDEENRLAESAAEAERAMMMTGVGDTLSATAELSSMLATQMESDNKRASSSVFDVSQALGKAVVVFNTAQGVMKAFAEYGPTPLGFVMAGLVASIGGVQLAQVKSQQAPAHMGDPLAPDERQVSGRRVLATETVLDSATTRRMGGEDGLREAMRGGGGSQPVQVNLTYKHLDREIARLMRSNSRTRRAVRS